MSVASSSFSPTTGDQGLSATFLNTEYEAVLFRMNKTSTFLNKSGQAFKGVIKGVSNSGKLKVQSDGIIDEYDLKTIQFIY